MERARTTHTNGVDENLDVCEEPGNLGMKLENLLSVIKKQYSANDPMGRGVEGGLKTKLETFMMVNKLGQFFVVFALPEMDFHTFLLHKTP